MRAFRWRFVWPIVLGTLCLVALCAFTAVSLFQQQATVTGVLRENVSSRRAAADLRGCLNTLVALEANQIEAVTDLHARAQTHLNEIRSLANHPTEVALSAKLDEGFAQYLHFWATLPPKNNPLHDTRVRMAGEFLESHVLLPCREIEGFNDTRVEETTTQHERILNKLAWGMAVVGGLGAIAGLILGFGVARLLSRSIRKLQVQIRDAAGKLGSESPEIVLTSDLGFGGLHDELDVLSTRIEAVVQQLHEREREVVRVEQLAAVGQLAAGVGHELRNPLTSIKMIVQTGLEGSEPSLTLEDLQIVEAEIRRMEQSLQMFLDFARPPKSERRETELWPILETVLGLIRGRAEKQGVSISIPNPLPQVRILVDPEQLRQVFVNLTLNALDVMPTGGELRFTVRRLPSELEIEVSDTGPGIAPSMLNRLFQPFASTKDTGLGLGLVICQRIVEEHGGSVSAKNQARGASFIVRLPMSG